MERVKCHMGCGCEADTTIVVKEDDRSIKRIQYPPRGWGLATVTVPQGDSWTIHKNYLCPGCLKEVMQDLLGDSEKKEKGGKKDERVVN